MQTPIISYKRDRFPPEIISHSVWLYYRFNLSFQKVEEMLLERGIDVSYETVRRWGAKFCPAIARGLRRQQPRSGDVWHLDAGVVTIKGEKFWLWRAVDQNGVVLDEILQCRRDKKAAKRLLRRVMKKQGRAPKRFIGGGLGMAPKVFVVLEQKIRSHIWAPDCRSILIVKSAIPKDSAAIGAAAHFRKPHG